MFWPVCQSVLLFLWEYSSINLHRKQLTVHRLTTSVCWCALFCLVLFSLLGSLEVFLQQGAHERQGSNTSGLNSHFSLVISGNIGNPVQRCTNLCPIHSNTVEGNVLVGLQQWRLCIPSLGMLLSNTPSLNNRLYSSQIQLLVRKMTLFFIFCFMLCKKKEQQRETQVYSQLSWYSKFSLNLFLNAPQSMFTCSAQSQPFGVAFHSQHIQETYESKRGREG